jgi:hypothetical protein
MLEHELREDGAGFDEYAIKATGKNVREKIIHCSAEIRMPVTGIKVKEKKMPIDFLLSGFEAQAVLPK